MKYKFFLVAAALSYGHVAHASAIEEDPFIAYQVNRARLGKPIKKSDLEIMIQNLTECTDDYNDFEAFAKSDYNVPSHLVEPMFVKLSEHHPPGELIGNENWAEDDFSDSSSSSDVDLPDYPNFKQILKDWALKQLEGSKSTLQSIDLKNVSFRSHLCYKERMLKEKVQTFPLSVQWHHNDSSADISNVYQYQTNTPSTFKWSLGEVLDVGFNVSGRVASPTVDVQTNFDFSKQRTSTLSVQDVWAIERLIHLPSKSSTKLNLSLTQKRESFPFEIRTEISGNFSVVSKAPQPQKTWLGRLAGGNKSVDEKLEIPVATPFQGQRFEGYEIHDNRVIFKVPGKHKRVYYPKCVLERSDYRVMPEDLEDDDEETHIRKHQLKPFATDTIELQSQIGEIDRHEENFQAAFLPDEELEKFFPTG